MGNDATYCISEPTYVWGARQTRSAKSPIFSAARKTAAQPPVIGLCNMLQLTVQAESPKERMCCIANKPQKSDPSGCLFSWEQEQISSKQWVCSFESPQGIDIFYIQHYCHQLIAINLKGRGFCRWLNPGQSNFYPCAHVIIRNKFTEDIFFCISTVNTQCM